jgi:hypothetical protein
LKKLAAILFAIVFLFNWFGYQIVVHYLEKKSDTQLEAQLDKQQYNDKDLVSIKVATNLPYYNESTEFQRTDGSIEIDGVEYKYVKKRFYNDSLELMCIPNVSKMKIKDAKQEYAKQTNDFQESGTKKKQSSPHPNVVKPIGTEYCQHHFVLSFTNKYEQLIEKASPAYIPVAIQSVFYAPQEQPPDVA